MGRPEHACSQATAPPDCPGSLLYGGEAVACSAVAEAVDGSASGIRAVRSRLGNAVSEPPPDAAGDTDPVCERSRLGAARAAGGTGAARRDGAGAERGHERIGRPDGGAVRAVAAGGMVPATI